MGSSVHWGFRCCVTGCNRPGSSTRWNRSGKRGSSRARTGSGPAVAAMDAIEAIYWTLKGRTAKRQWVLDADLSAAFDRIDHDRLLAELGTFPGRGMVAGWLAAGVVEEGRFSPDRGRNSPRRGGQPDAAQHRPARDGTSRRSPLPTTRHLRGRDEQATPRRWCGTPTTSSSCATPGTRQNRSSTSWVSGWPHGALRSTRTRRSIVHVDRGLRLLGVQHPPLPRQAAHQTQPGGR